MWLCCVSSCVWRKETCHQQTLKRVFLKEGFLIHHKQVPLSLWPHRLFKWLIRCSSNTQKRGGRSSQHIIHYLWTLVCRHRTDCNRETQSKEQRTGDQASRGPECFIIIFIKRNYYLVIIYSAWSTDGCSGRRCACCCCSPHVCSWRTSAGPAEGNCNIWEWVPINQLSDNRYFLTVYHLTWSGLLASCLKSAL